MVCSSSDTRFHLVSFPQRRPFTAKPVRDNWSGVKVYFFFPSRARSLFSSRENAVEEFVISGAKKKKGNLALRHKGGEV